MSSLIIGFLRAWIEQKMNAPALGKNAHWAEAGLASSLSEQG